MKFDLSTVEGLYAAQDSTARRTVTLRGDIHTTLVATIALVQSSGDCGHIERYWLKLAPNRKAGTDFLRAKAVKAWVEAFTPIRLPIKDGEHARFAKGERNWDVDAARETPFWEYTAEQTPVRLAADFLAAPYANLARFEKAREAGQLYNEDGVAMSTEEYTAIRQILVDMCALSGMSSEDAKAARSEAATLRKKLQSSPELGSLAA